MSHKLYRKLNHRNIRLDSDTVGETVGILCKDASIQYRVWGGFKTRVEAKRIRRALPVLLNISRVDGVDLIDGEYVQGCLLDDRVYAVIDSQVAIVTKTKA